MAPKSTRRIPVVPLAVGLTSLGVLGLVVVSFSLGAMDASPVLPMAYTMDSIPDRFTRIVLSPSEPEAEEGESAVGRKDGKVTSEEGRVGRQSEVSAQLRAETGTQLKALGYVDDASGSELGETLDGLLGARGASGGSGAFGTGLGGGGVGVKGRSGPRRLGAASANKPLTAAIPEEAPAGETHIDHGVSGFSLAEVDRLSTFAADVDTASFTQARGHLNASRLPVAAAVRVEEFVNAFDYGYAPPADDAPFSVHLDAAPHPWESGRTLLRVGIKGAEVDASVAPPVHLTFLVDTSGSMSSRTKMPLVKTALHTLVANLGDDDTVAVVTYAGSTQILLRPTSASASDQIHEVIGGLGTGGGTDMGSGVDLAYQLARAAYVRGHENRVIVLSDGDANVGDTSHTQLLRRIEQSASEGVTLTTVGFGQGNYNDALMEQLADKGDGASFYIDSAKEARHRFSGELTGTLRTIAKDVKLQVEFNPAAVHSYRLVGYENRDIADQDFRDDSVDAGEIGSGHQVTALYELILVDDGPSELATVRVRAREPGPDAPAREWATLVDSGVVHAELADATPAFRKAVAVAGFAEVLRGSRFSEELTYSELYRLASGAVGSSERDQELLTLIETAGTLSGETMAVARR